MNRRARGAPVARTFASALIACVLAACAQAPADAALQACRDLVAQKSGTPIGLERKAMQISTLDANTNTLQVSGPLKFIAADGSAHIETLDCRVRIGDGSVDVIHLQLSWSTQELERTLRESR